MSSVWNRIQPTVWILLWVACSILPLLPFVLPLLHDTLGDTPLAYLTWIPVMAFFWAGWNLYRIPILQDRSRTGLGLLLIAATCLLLWASRDQAWILALWPIWSVSAVSLFFGFGALKAVYRPMVYLLLACPPVYLAIVAAVGPALERAAKWIVSMYSDSVSWMKADAVSDGVAVQSGSKWVLVHITTACSGADSILAILILFPVMLVVFKASLIRKSMFVFVGGILVVISNIVRILLIITALHYFGMSFALDVLHPLLGAVLFFATIGLLLIFGSRRLLLNGTPDKIKLNAPTKVRLAIVLVAVFIMTMLLSLN